MTLFASGAAAATYWFTTACTAGSASDGSACRTTPGPGALRALLTIDLPADADTSSPVLSLILSVMSLSARPNDDALVIKRVTPPAVIVQRYSACVWAETITLIRGSSRLAMSAIGLPA